MSGVAIMVDHLSKHHDDAVGVQETGGVPLIQSNLGLHRRPGAAAEVVVLGLGAGNLQMDVFIRKAHTLIRNQRFRSPADHILPPQHSRLD